MDSHPRLLAWILLTASVCAAQTNGAVSGSVTLESSREPMHAAQVVLSPLGRSAVTDEQGRYKIEDVPPGVYEVIARSPGLTSDRQTVRVTAGGSGTADFALRLATVRESVTVTASGNEEVALDVVQPVTALGQIEMQLRSAASLGEVLSDQPGIAKRSFGPGASRPVVRGFDGDRVLILEDGVRTGTLSSQSGDHGEPVDVNSLEQLEVVRGPATLLYGSSAIGGVVNATSRHDLFHVHAHDGVRGYLTGTGGTNNGTGGGSGGFEFGKGPWQFWASGGGQRTGDYSTPEGPVRNSQSRIEQTSAGLGRKTEKGFVSFNYGFTESRYGIPVAPAEEQPEAADILLRRHAYRVSAGLRGVGFVDAIRVTLNYTDYNHKELVDETPQTALFNKQFIYRTVFDQKKRGPWSGSFGFWGMRRDYKTIGEESLAPPTSQDAFAAFGVENLSWEKWRVQFGGRLEQNRYHPAGLEARVFTGFSGAVGVSRRLWENGALAVNYSRSYRAPAIEELYNHGPHAGNLTFEIGNPNLNSERNDGIDISLRHHSSRVHSELNGFYYHINNFVYLAPTGAIQDGLTEARYDQRNSRFIGGEAKVDVRLHPNLWLNLGADAVNARLTNSNLFLPRIPPLRGRVGFDATYKGLSFRPELAMAYAQNKIFPTETRTAGYAVANVTGSYTIARAHNMHIVSATLFNAGDRLYRNHLSFIKEFAPEIGRGFRFGYTVQFF